MESVRCSCNVPINYELYDKILKTTNLTPKEILEILEVDKDCCKLKYLTCAKISNYTGDTKK